MHAIILDQYGPPADVLKIADVARPIPNDHQVLIKVHAAAVNPADYGCVDGTVRFMTGVFKPKRNRLGLDVAGRVLAVGDKVTQFKAGDEVYGACIRNPYTNSRAVWLYDFGSFAEYAISHEGALALKPKNLSFEQAAATPCTAWTALQGVRTFGKIQSGQKVLVSSATGGVGTFAVQLAKAFDTEVTGVCSTKNVELVRSLGADRVIDYTKEDYSKQGQRYDMIFDSVGEHSFSALRQVLNPGGTIVVVAKRSSSFLDFVWRILAGTMRAKLLGDKIVVDYSKPSKEDLLLISDLLSAEKIRPVIEKQYHGLAEVPKAVQHVKEGHAWGKVVITL